MTASPHTCANGEGCDGRRACVDTPHAVTCVRACERVAHFAEFDGEDQRDAVAQPLAHLQRRNTRRARGSADRLARAWRLRHPSLLGKRVGVWGVAGGSAARAHARRGT
jgi:uncharacterized protein (DUF2384 family)